MKENYERWMNREIQRFQARGEVPVSYTHLEHGPQSVDIPIPAAEMRQHLHPGFPLKLGSAHHLSLIHI